MSQALLISVRLHDGRYHGSGSWPPSPARLFQALVAAAASGGLTDEYRKALRWLEERSTAPLIAAPAARSGQAFGNFVPNNELDAVGGDARRVGEIRTATKRIRPWLFDAATPLLYAWSFEAGSDNELLASAVCGMAEGLYQLGRGVDMAWAVGEIIDAPELEQRLAQFSGSIHRPCFRGNGLALECPGPGSLASLEERFAAGRKRFTVIPGKKTKQLLTQAPKPRFRQVAYDSPTTKLLFDLRQTSKPGTPFTAWPLTRTAELVRIVRGNDGENGQPTSGVFKRLTDALPGQEDCIRRVLIGRDASEADKSLRARILPLPSTGHMHVEHSIRRVLVEVPPNCPLRLDDLAWAMSGLVIAETLDTDTGELLQTRLVSADDRKMLGHYGVGELNAGRIWRSVTPLALPQAAARRRIEPTRQRDEAKDGRERQAEQSRASTAVLQALRHADIGTQVSSLRVQREPFSAKGARAEGFAPGTRFAKERLWHVEVGFAEPVSGPLALGDGRYAGLGLMEPVQRVEGIYTFAIVEGLAKTVDGVVISSALRRAVMARVQEVIGRRSELPAFFTGHESDGTPARKGSHIHLAFVADLARSRLLIVAPHMLEGRSPTRDERSHLKTLTKAIDKLTDLRAGSAGRLKLAPALIEVDDDPLFASARHWESVTNYHPTRHAKRLTPAEALIADVQLELRRRGMPAPDHIDAIDVRKGSRGGLTGRLYLSFAIAVPGPVIIGHTRHVGGGLFAGVIDREPHSQPTRSS